MSNINGPNGPKDLNAVNLNNGTNSPAKAQAKSGSSKITAKPASGDKTVHSVDKNAADALANQFKARNMTKVLSGKINPELMAQLGSNGELAQGAKDPNAMSDALFNTYLDQIGEEEAYTALEERFNKSLFAELGLQNADA